MFYNVLYEQLNSIHLNDKKPHQYIGQEFTHQIFIVFSKDNPDIYLISINMKEGETKMHVHVSG